MQERKHVYTVSELSHRIRTVLDGSFAQIWVQGEVSNFKLAPSGHMYFSLKDKNSELSAALFKGSNRGLKFELKNGIEVICLGKVSFYEVRGRCQFLVEKVEPKGVGALQLAFEQLKLRLKNEGLFDPKHKQSIPFFPQRIGVVTSPTGAAIRDILSILNRRFANLEVLISPTRVQGEGSAQEIARAIEQFNSFGKVDVLIVGRGGGSLEDLWAFNEEVVARAIFNSRIPVISAVGHEIDYTISDFVADSRAATPSEAAEKVIIHKQELVERINNFSSRMDSAIYYQVKQLEERYNSLKQRYAFRQPGDLILQHQQTIDNLTAALDTRLKHLIEINQERYNVLVGKLQALSPLNILSRGYSISWLMPQREVIKQARLLKAGMKVETKLAQGSFISRIEKVD